MICAFILLLVPILVAHRGQLWSISQSQNRIHITCQPWRAAVLLYCLFGFVALATETWLKSAYQFRWNTLSCSLCSKFSEHRRENRRILDPMNRKVSFFKFFLRNRNIKYKIPQYSRLQEAHEAIRPTNVFVHPSRESPKGFSCLVNAWDFACFHIT